MRTIWRTFVEYVRKYGVYIRMSDNANMHCYFFTLNLFFQLIQIFFEISYLIIIYKSASRCSGRLLF